MTARGRDRNEKGVDERADNEANQHGNAPGIPFPIA